MNNNLKRFYVFVIEILLDVLEEDEKSIKLTKYKKDEIGGIRGETNCESPIGGMKSRW